MSLRALQAQMHRALRGEASPEAVAKGLGCDPRRLSVYVEMVRGHVRTALEKNFVVLRELVSPPTWEALVEGYFRAHPPSHWELNAAAEAFPAWLEGRVEAWAPVEPFHVELAQFEWELLVALQHPAEMPVAPGAPSPNPTIAVLSFRHPVATFASAWYAGRRDLPLPAPAPQRVLVYRHPVTARAMFAVATDDLLFALKVSYEGLDAGAAARSIGQPEAAGRSALATARDAGLILG